MGDIERWSSTITEMGTEWVPRREADALADAADIYAVAIEASGTPADQLWGAVDLIEQARECVTAALNCTAHPWHGSDEARKWLMAADRLGGQ